LVLAPAVAAACPNCVGQQRNTGILKLVGAFMLVPFIVVYSVVRVIRRAQREPDQMIGQIVQK
jgi:prolipoprotein diacylglyceryltransferase